MHKTYENIFDRCGLNYKIVLADTGAIGGSGSHQFMALSEVGESDIISAKSVRIMLAKPEDFFKIITDKLNDKNTQKINVAIVGAGDFYFPAKEFFSTIK